MQCKYCGQRLLDTAKRCPSCKSVFTEDDIREMLGGKLPGENSSGQGTWQTSDDTQNGEDSYASAQDGKNAWERAREESWARSEQENTGYTGYSYREKTGYQSQSISEEERRKMSLARAGLWCGIGALFLCMTLPVLGIGIGIFGIVNAVRGLKSPMKRRAVTGLVLCIMAILTAICFWYMSSAIAEHIDWSKFLEMLAESQGISLE